MKKESATIRKIAAETSGLRGFQFDSTTRKFIKKIQSRKFLPPPEIHLELKNRVAVRILTDVGIIELTNADLKANGLRLA
jgi:hypothetical protein